MRNFRKAAFAGATAVAVAFGSTAVAAADTTPTAPEFSHTRVQDVPADAQPDFRTKVGNKVEAWYLDEDGKVQATGVEKKEFFGEWTKETPVWSKILFAGGIAAMVSAIIGLIVGPAYNFFVHGPAAF